MPSSKLEIIEKSKILFPSDDSSLETVFHLDPQDSEDSEIWASTGNALKSLIHLMPEDQTIDHSDFLEMISYMDKLIALRYSPIIKQNKVLRYMGEFGKYLAKYQLLLLLVLNQSSSTDIPQNQTKVFKLIPTDNKEAKDALNHFAQTAKLIRRDSHFDNSIAHNIELMLQDTSGFIRRYGGYECPPGEVRINRTCIALAAPSLVGKTQLAFLLQSKRPMFFMLSHSHSEQDIYDNFTSISSCMVECAIMDSKVILRRDIHEFEIQNKSLANEYDLITATELDSNFRYTKFYSLGLLLAIYKDYKLNYNPAVQQSWMHFFSMEKALSVEPVSISELLHERELISEFCVFLDEFQESFLAVLIRNLVRAVGMSCLVANTNTKIANLVGKNPAKLSRGASSSVWAVAICKLDPFNRNVFKSIFDWNSLVKSVLGLIEPESQASVKKILNSVFTNQLEHLRPGIAVFLADAMRHLVYSDEKKELKLLEAVECIDYIISFISTQIQLRKSRILTSLDGQIGNFALNCSVAFEPEAVIENIFNSKSFLQDHLYYLVNPIVADEWFFCLYVIHTTKNIQIFKDGNYLNWTELSYFNSKETLTLLACLFLTIRKPVASLMLNDRLRYLSLNTALGFQNPKKKTNPGMDFEVATVMSMVDASHFSVDDTLNFTASLKGVTFVEFLENILRNMSIKSDETLILNNQKSPIDIDFDLKPSNSKFEAVIQNISKKLKSTKLVETSSKEVFDLNRHLSKFRIPFLFPSNVALPNSYEEIFKINDPTCLLKLGEFERTADLDKIDACFDIVSSLSTVIKGVVECKDFTSKDLGIDICIQILTKFLAFDDPKFGFIFCDSIGGIKRQIPRAADENIKALIKFSADKKINIYRFVKTSEVHFKIVPFRKDLKVSDNPKMIVFVFASDEINE